MDSTIICEYFNFERNKVFKYFDKDGKTILREVKVRDMTTDELRENLERVRKRDKGRIFWEHPLMAELKVRTLLANKIADNFPAIIKAEQHFKNVAATAVKIDVETEETIAPLLEQLP